MRSSHRIPIIILAILALAVSACAPGRDAQSLTPTPGPVKTQRPTFTPAPVQPTQVPLPTATAVVPIAEQVVPTVAPPEVSPTPEPPAATPTSESASLVVQNPTVNVRGGPSTSFATIGQVRSGQSFPVTGKNAGGDWWEFDFNGRSGWISGSMVRVTNAASVEVAANIPTIPTRAPQAPRPTARPQPQPQPAQPTYQFAARETRPYPNTNDYLTVRCRSEADLSDSNAPAGILTVSGPGGGKTQPFGGIFNRANTGMDKTMQYTYNENCKIELGPYVAGSYTAMLVDGGGKQISDAITFNTSGDQREFLLVWNVR